jgi:hypothetical protein
VSGGSERLFARRPRRRRRATQDPLRARPPPPQVFPAARERERGPGRHRECARGTRRWENEGLRGIGFSPRSPVEGSAGGSPLRLVGSRAVPLAVPRASREAGSLRGRTKELALAVVDRCKKSNCALRLERYQMRTGMKRKCAWARALPLFIVRNRDSSCTRPRHSPHRGNK